MSGSTVDNSRLRGDKEAAGDIDQHAARRSMKINTNSSIDAAQIHTHSTPVVFKGLTYSVASHSNKGQQVALLKNLSGCFSPGQMSALMGPSGSGKTTLLDVLAGRKTQGEIKGDIFFAAHTPTLNFLRRFTGYVEQFDTLVDNLTVREMLLYTAEMKRRVKEPFATKETIVDKYIDVLGLESCKNTKIGNSMNRGISGGQAKRTNVALAMVVNPRVLFLDEPTSGLDSYSSNETMTVVKSLVKEGVTICATIHSPSAYTFALFDRLLVLVRGECVYHGPNGEHMVAYFGGCGVTPPKTALTCSAITNDSDYLTDLVVGADRTKRYPEFVVAYDKSDLKKEMLEIVSRHAQDDTMKLTDEDKDDLKVKRATTTPLWKGLITLIKYRTTKNYRAIEFMGPRLATQVVFLILMGTLYYGIGDKLQEDNYSNIAAVMFMCNIMPAFSAAGYLPALSMEKSLFIRERNDGLYRPITYLLSKILEELFISVCLTLVVTVAIWFLIQLQGSFLMFWITYFVTMAVGVVMAYACAIIAPTMTIANASLPMYTITIVFMSGFLIRFDDIPDYWQWYAYLSFLRYGWSALMMNQFEGQTETAPVAGAEIRVSGVPIAEFYAYNNFESKWVAVAYEAMFFVAFFVFAWLGLQYGTMNKR